MSCQAPRQLTIPGLDDAPRRPTKRSECADGPRPCPWYSCRYHLGLDVDSRGRLYLHTPPERLAERPHSCALDVAELGGHTLAEVAAIIGTGRSRVHQIELRAHQRFIDEAPPHLVDLLARK